MHKLGLIALLAVACTFTGTEAGTQLPWRTLDINIDGEPFYTIAWQVARNARSIIFDITVATKGYIGFGISPTASMWEADLYLGGVYDNGTSYLFDRHGVGQTAPIEDASQDVDLLYASENATHTNIRILRLLDTQDPEDNAITNGETNFVWSHGQTDQFYYHGPNRGSVAVNILGEQYL